MEAQEFKITLNEGSTRTVRALAVVFHDEDSEAQSLSATDVRTVIRADVPQRRVRHAAI